MNNLNMTLGEFVKKGGEARKKTANYSEMGKKGGGTNKAKGPEYFSMMGKKSAEKRAARKLQETQSQPQTQQ